MSSVPNESTFATREDVAEALVFLGRCSPAFDQAHVHVSVVDAWHTVLSGMFVPPSAFELLAAAERVARREPMPAVAHLCVELESMRRLSSEAAAAVAGDC